MASELDARLQAIILHVGGMASGATTTDQKPLIVGMADPFSTIDVYDGTALLGVVSSNGQGHWSLQLSAPLYDGIHDLSAVQVTGYGVNSTASYFAITVDASGGSGGAADEGLSFSNAPRHADNAAENGSPYFPANLFNSHAAAAASENTGKAQAMPTTATSGEDSHNDAQSYVRQTSAHTASGKGFDMVSFLGDHQVLDLSSLNDKSSIVHTPGIGGFDLGGHH